MSELFSDSWMKQLQAKWNASEEIITPLADAGFSARIAYGFKGEDKARGLLVIKDGVVSSAGDYDGEEVDWDLRAAPDRWVFAYVAIVKAPS